MRKPANEYKFYVRNLSRPGAKPLLYTDDQAKATKEADRLTELGLRAVAIDARTAKTI